MLKKTQRVQRADFAGFLKNGKRFHATHMTIVFTPFPTFHASVVVSKKVAKLAVTRNTLRRRVYAKLAALKNKEKTGVFIAVLKPSFGALTKKMAQEEVTQLIVKIEKAA